MAQHSQQQTRRYRTHGTTKKATMGTAGTSTGTRMQQRRTVRAAPPPIDYSEDYAFVSRDLKYIALWSILLFAGMFGVYFFI